MIEKTWWEQLHKHVTIYAHNYYKQSIEIWKNKDT